MSYGTKRIVRFNDYSNNKWKVEIQKDGYSGPVVDETGGDTPVQLRKDNFEPFDPLSPSELTVDAYSLTDLQFREFFDAEIGDYRAILTNTTEGQEYWRGINIADTYSEPFEMTPYPSSIRFFDGIGKMGDVRYVDGNGDPVSKTASLREILFDCLDLIGLGDIPIRDATNVFHNAITTSQSPLNNTQVKTTNYRDKEDEGDHYEYVATPVIDVIRGICKALGAHIFQWKGAWWVVRYGTYVRDQLDYFELDKNGNETPGSVDHLVTQPTPLSQDHELETKTDIDRIIIKYKSENDTYDNGSITQNPYFIDWTEGSDYTDSNKPVGWEVSSDLNAYTITEPAYMSLYDASISNIQNRHSWPAMYSRFELSLFDKRSDVLSYWIRQTNDIEVASADNMDLRFTLSGHVFKAPAVDQNTGISLGMDSEINKWMREDMAITQLIKVKIEDLDTGDTYWLHSVWYPNGEDVSTSASIPSFASPSWETTSGYVEIPVCYDLYPNRLIDDVTPFTSGSDDVKSLNIPTPNFPFTGSARLTIEWYPPYSNIPDYNNNLVITPPDPNPTGPPDVGDSVKTSMGTNPVDMDYWGIADMVLRYKANGNSTSLTKVIEQINNNSVDRREVDLIHGDGPAATSRGSFRDNTGSITESWARLKKTESFGIMEVLSLDMSDMMKTRTQVLSGSYLGSFDLYSKIRISVATLIDTQIYDFMILGGSWDIKREEWTLDLWEIADNAIPLNLNPGVGDDVGITDAQIPSNIANIPSSPLPPSVTGASTSTTTVGTNNVSAGITDDQQTISSTPI